jgi:hypothetical protein
VSTAAWVLCAGWIAAAAGLAVAGARRGLAEGRGRRASARLKSPTLYLFTAYLVVAALATPHEAGESTSPLLWLAIVLPAAYLLATLSAIGRARRSAVGAAALGLVHGGAVLAASAIVLAISSPAFVPGALR